MTPCPRDEGSRRLVAVLKGDKVQSKTKRHRALHRSLLFMARGQDKSKVIFFSSHADDSEVSSSTKHFWSCTDIFCSSSIILLN